MKATGCEACRDGRGTIQNGSSFCSPCAKGKFSDFAETLGICQLCDTNAYQDGEEKKRCKACPSGFFASGRGNIACKRPQVQASLFAVPSALSLRVVKSSGSSQNNEHMLVLSWSFDTTDAALTVPGGFDVRISSSREFTEGPKTVVLPNRIIGAASREARIYFPDPATEAAFKAAGIEIGPLAPWMMPTPTYMQVRAFDAGSADRVGKWSLPTQAWALAQSCSAESEFLEVNGTDNLGLSPNDWHCEKCPRGASCHGAAIWRDVRPLAGYWRIPWSARGSEFERCPFTADCVGYDPAVDGANAGAQSTDGANATELEEMFEANSSATTQRREPDGCALGTTGVLCSICAEGYHRDVVTCVQCQEETLGVRVAILIILFLVLLVLLALFRRQLLTKWRKYRPLYRDVLRIFAIVVTFQQINTSLTSIIEVPWPRVFSEFVASFAIVNIDIFSLAGVGCVGNFNFMLGFIGMMGLPGSIIVWACCNLWVSRKAMDKRIAGMPEAEKNLQEEEALHMLFHIADSDGGGHICAAELSTLLRQLGWQVKTEDARAVIEAFIGHGKEWEDAEGRLVLGESTFVASMMSGRMAATLRQKNHDVVRRTRTRSMSFSRSKSKSLMDQDEKTEKKKPKQAAALASGTEGASSLLCDRDRLVRWVHGKRIFADSLAGATALLMLAHTPVSRKVFQYFHCNNLAGQLYMFADYTVKCYSDEWFAFLPIVLLVLMFFTMAIPITISLYLFRHRDHLYSAVVQQKVGWLYAPFRRGVEFWQVHDVVLKMVLTGLLIYIPMTARTAVAAMVSFAFCVLGFEVRKSTGTHKKIWLTLSPCTTRIPRTKIAPGSLPRTWHFTFHIPPDRRPGLLQSELLSPT
jgi:hypothetical protein